MTTKGLSWLPDRSDWIETLKGKLHNGALHWQGLIGLSQFNLDYTRTTMLDRAMKRVCGGELPVALTTAPVRLALLGSSTVDYLIPSIKVGGLRRGLWIDIKTTEYGQYRHSLSDVDSDLKAFQPTHVLLCLDARHLVGDLDAASSQEDADAVVARAISSTVDLWELAQGRFQCRVLQHIPVPVFKTLAGHNEHRIAGSKANVLARISKGFRDAADKKGVDVLSTDDLVRVAGLDTWHDPGLWLKAKHEIRAAAAPLWGDHVARVLAAQQGRSSKCLVLDLDNTLWGGVIGDDGLEHIVLGQGSAIGEAFVGLQHYARDLAHRGVILAVCSKNDEANALMPFESHPEMVLKRSDIACFVANWDDKATNLQRIAQSLNIGTDSLVFVDDNPFERNLVRQHLPEVAVPELPEDPSLFADRLSAAGYFETTGLTAEDVLRSEQYQANSARERVKVSSGDVEGYLRALDMQLSWKPFDRIGLARITQLINKTNQFNLTTRRLSERDVADLIGEQRSLTLQIRLADRFGDNGIIAIVIGRLDGRDLHIETWLMSCRVLGRHVERATLNVVMEHASHLGVVKVIGTFIPTAKNDMVRDHYPRLGFAPAGADGVWSLRVDEFQPFDVPIEIAGQREMVSA